MELSECIILSQSQLDRIEEKLDQLLTRELISSTEYLTDADVLKMLGIKKQTLYNWKSSKKIPFHKQKGCSKSYYKYDEIIAFQQGIKHNSNACIESDANNYILNRRKH